MKVDLLLLYLTGLLCTALSDSGCAPRSITMDEKMKRVAQDNDHNGDGVVTTSDVIYDLSNNYDTDNNGVVTEKEFLVRWMCEYGDDFYLANYITNLITGGRAGAPLSAIQGPPYDTGVPLDAFLANNRQRYVAFASNSCLNRNLTIAQKLNLAVADNDYNNDNLVTAADIEHDLSTHYDTDNDGQVTQQEWVMRWICRYGDSGDYARSVWAAYNSNGLPSLAVNYFSFPPFDTGMPIAAFRNMNRQRYERWEQQGNQIIGK